MSATASEHYKAPFFGIEDIQLPAGHNLRPSSENEDATTKVVGRVEDQKLDLSIRFLHDADRVALEVGSMETICKDNDDIHMVEETPTDVDYGITDTQLSKACTHRFKPFGDAPPDAIHWVILQSRFGHGLSIQFTGPLEKLDATKETAGTALGSLKWVDRASLLKDISSQMVGSWWTQRLLPAYLALYGGLVKEDTTYTYKADGTFTTKKVTTESRRKDGKKNDVRPGTAPGGKYKLLQTDGNKGIQLVMTAEDTGQAVMQDGKFLDKTCIEFSSGRFLNREKVPFWKKLAGKS